MSHVLCVVLSIIAAIILIGLIFLVILIWCNYDFKSILETCNKFTLSDNSTSSTPINKK